MVNDIIDMKLLLITISLTICYFYITTDNEIIFKKNYN
jgi:hypothetical protein